MKKGSKRPRRPNRIYPEGFEMTREEFMFRCFMAGAKRIHKRLSDKRVLLNIHNYYDWKHINKGYTGRGFVWFNVKMGPEHETFWDDWEGECKKLKMRYKITSNGTFRKRTYTVRLEW
jgi:hypothetical protein